jgi:hypothetical protein
MMCADRDTRDVDGDSGGERTDEVGHGAVAKQEEQLHHVLSTSPCQHKLFQGGGTTTNGPTCFSYGDEEEELRGNAVKEVLGGGIAKEVLEGNKWCSSLSVCSMQITLCLIFGFYCWRFFRMKNLQLTYMAYPVFLLPLPKKLRQAKFKGRPAGPTRR